MLRGGAFRYVKNRRMESKILTYLSEWIPAVRRLTNNTNLKLDLDNDDDMEIFRMKHETINSHNIDIFEGCELVVGSLVFQVHTFTDQDKDIPQLTYKDLSKLRHIKGIMGYLSVAYWPFESFDVFEQLETIYGQHALYKNVVALFLASNRERHQFKKVHELKLRSLQSIENGNVVIKADELSDACHLTTINWKQFIKRPQIIANSHFEDGLLVKLHGREDNMFDSVKHNDKCTNFKCHPECKNGCWGDGNLSCIECKNKAYFGELKECLPACHEQLSLTNGTQNELSLDKVSARSVQDGKLLYSERGSTQCQQCHNLCKVGCSGPKKTECWDCKYAKMRNFIPKTADDPPDMPSRWTLECRDDLNCPDGYFLNTTNYCEHCSNRCDPKSGCTGPGDYIGYAGCNACSSVTIPRDYIGLNQTSNSKTGLHCRLSSQVKLLYLV